MLTTFEKEIKRRILQDISFSHTNSRNPALFVVEINHSKPCSLTVIYHSDPYFSNHTCLDKIADKITYSDGKPCIADCLNKLKQEGSIFTEAIWPFHKNRLSRKRIVYLYYYKPFNWIIGSCAPTNFEAVFPSFKTTLKKSMEQYSTLLVASLFLISLLSAGLIYAIIFSKILYKPISSDISTIINFFENYKGEELNTKSLSIEETEKIAERINRLFKEINRRNRQIEGLLSQFEKLAENMPACLGIFKRDKDKTFKLSFANSKFKYCPYFKPLKGGVYRKTLDEILKNKDVNHVIDTAFKYETTVEFTTTCPFANKIVHAFLYKLSEDSVVCILNDATDSVKQFRERKKSRRVLETFLDKIKTGMIVLTRKTEIIYINTFAKKLLGLKEHETLNIRKLNLPEKIKYKFLKILHKKRVMRKLRDKHHNAGGKKPLVRGINRPYPDRERDAWHSIVQRYNAKIH